jgi:hypothetical protein
MNARLMLVAGVLIIPLLPIAGADTASEYQLMELKTQAPSWWTPEAMAGARAAAERGELFNPVTGASVVPPPLGGLPLAPDYVFIRPGALFLSESGAICTYNFIYSNHQQIGTAGHCVEGRGEVVYILAAPTIPLVTALGKVAGSKNAGVGNDYALIDIDSQWSQFVDPNVAYVGGPSCSVWTPAVEAGKHVGHGIQTGLIASVPRVSAITDFDGRSFEGAGELSGGDSGSPMVEAAGSLPGCVGGGAVGVLTHCATITGIECLPLFFGTDIRRVPATVTTGLDPV